MAKNTNRAASAIAYVAALLLATGAWSYHWDLDVKEPVTYAQEIFGGDNVADMDLTLKGDDVLESTEDRQGTRVELQLVLPTGTDARTVATDSVVEITFKLEGAVFGQAINWPDITTGARLAKEPGSQRDGIADDSSVTIKVTVVNGGELSGGGDENEVDGATVSLFLGSLEGATSLPAGGTVTASAEMRVTAGDEDNPFPTLVQVRKAREEADAVMDDPDTDDDETAVAITERDGTMDVVASAKKAVTFMAAGNTIPGAIDLDDRGKLAAAATNVKIGSLSYMVDVDAFEADGKTSFAGEGGEGTQANITVTVSGMVRDSDTVYFDQDDDKKMGPKEELTITDGVASKIFRLSNIGNIDGTSVYFVPDGTTAMTAGTITAMFAVEYDATSVVDPMPVSGMVLLEYDGIAKKARAYAIPNPGTNDIANVRIKCGAEGDAMCTVFLACSEQDGTPHFEELGTTIAAGATVVLQAEDIGEVLDTDTWDGRLSCDVLSDEAVSVQVLVRSDGSLINNTYIDGD